MARRPSMQFYPADFLGGTALLTCAATGAYIRMLCHSWETGAIPDTKAALFKSMGLGPDDPTLEQIWNEIASKWTLSNGAWTNARLEQTRADRDEFIERQRAKGKLGGRPKRDNTEKPEESRGLPETKPGLSETPENTKPNTKPDESRKKPLRSPSPISDLRSTDPDLRTAREGRAPKGNARATPHTHKNKAESKACKRGLCPSFLPQREFIGQSGRTPDQAVAYVDTFLEWGVDQVQGYALNEDPIKFWREMWKLYHSPGQPGNPRLHQRSWREECEELHAGACEDHTVHFSKKNRDREAIA